MSVAEERRLLPQNIQERQDQLLNTLFGVPGGAPGLIDQELKVPQRTVEGLSQDELDAAARARQGLGAFQPFIDTARSAQAAGLGATEAGTNVLAGAQFEPTLEAIKKFEDPYQKFVTDEAIKEIDRQAAMAQNKLAGDAVKAGAFGGSRFGIAQSELARSAQDLRSRRIFEDLSRNFQQAQAASRAANQQRLQAGQVFGQLGRATSGIGGALAGLGAQTQALQGQDVNRLLGIGGMQQQQAQQEMAVDYQNLLAQQQAPFETLGAGANILQQISPQTVGQQTISPMATTNPFAQAAGIMSTGVGLKNLLG